MRREFSNSRKDADSFGDGILTGVAIALAIPIIMLAIATLASMLK